MHIGTTITPAKRRLLQVMQEVYFGRIDGLVVRDGEPIFDPAPKVVREIKFGGDNGPKPIIINRALFDKPQIAELFEHLAQISEGVIQSLEVQRGLPFRMRIEESIGE